MLKKTLALFCLTLLFGTCSIPIFQAIEVGETAFKNAHQPQHHSGLQTRALFTATEDIQQWNQTIGGSACDGATSVIQTSDGGFALVGFTKSYGAGANDFWLVKTNSNGEVQWMQSFGDTSDDWAWDVLQTADDGYLLAGYAQWPIGTGLRDAWLVKTDPSGNMVWTQPYGGPARDEANAIIQTTDGGFVFVGTTASSGTGPMDTDAWLVKTDVNGVKQWVQTYGGSKEEEGWAVLQTPDNGFALIGFTKSYGEGGWDTWLVKTDVNGEVLWTQTYGGSKDDMGYEIIQTMDGGFAFGGVTWSWGRGGDFWLVTTDANGVLQRKWTYGGGATEWAWSVIQTMDGGFTLAGHTYSYGKEYSADFWLIQTDSDGLLQWSWSYGGTADDWAWDILQVSDEELIIAGIFGGSYKAAVWGGSCDAGLVKVIPMPASTPASDTNGGGVPGLTGLMVLAALGSIYVKRKKR